MWLQKLKPSLYHLRAWQMLRGKCAHMLCSTKHGAVLHGQTFRLCSHLFLVPKLLLNACSNVTLRLVATVAAIFILGIKKKEWEWQKQPWEQQHRLLLMKPKFAKFAFVLPVSVKLHAPFHSFSLSLECIWYYKVQNLKYLDWLKVKWILHTEQRLCPKNATSCINFSCELDVSSHLCLQVCFI